MNVIFVGGIFSEQDKAALSLQSKGPMQYAADTLQKNYIEGFCLNDEVKEVFVVNLPFIGAYPARYKTAFYRPVKTDEMLGRASIKNIGFFNLSLIKHIYRMILAYKGILLKVRSFHNTATVVCYSMHLPFLLACYFVKLFVGKGVHFCVIVPDLPEYMTVRTGISKRIFSLLSRISYLVVNRADSIVAITDHMVKKFNSAATSVVIEGIADKSYVSRSGSVNRESYYLYTGTLDRRYGIRNLIDSFVASGVKDYQLIICGDGDDRPYVEKISSECERIKYMGQLNRESVLELQRNASLLVNPRDNDSDYTKYSFPSKVIEYMSSGVPVLMYRLDGIPEEYYNFCYAVPAGSRGLERKLLEISKLDSAEMVAKGVSAKSFIERKKMPDMQVAKLIFAIVGGRCV
jgi:glycosyltransferase involved in cell wall biosynthesis